MNTILSLRPLPFEVTYDRTDLKVAAKVYVNSSGGWWLHAVVPMVHVGEGTYACDFLPTLPDPHIVTKASYYDTDYEDRDTDRGVGSESFVLDTSISQALIAQTHAPVTDVCGYIDSDSDIAGFIDDLPVGF